MKFLFELGQVVATRGVADQIHQPWLAACLQRHVSGDWGAVCAEDAAVNDEAVRTGGRILSAYSINPDLPCEGFGDNTIWIITEWDRSVTTFLLPEEY